jgi:two-component system response regulator YesN
MYSVMIVDDYEVYRREIRSMGFWGEASGFVIAAEAADGREALQKLRLQPVDLLLTDIRMPLVSGLELLNKVTAEKLSHCVILMSQFSDFEYARQGLSSGAFDYLLKPVNPDDLPGVLARAARYLDEKNLQMTKISYLDSLLNKASEDFFPEEAFSSLTGALTEGDPQAHRAASGLVHTTFAELDYDAVKTAHVLTKVLKRLAEALQSELTWLDKFINLQEFRTGDFSKLGDIKLLEEAFTGKIDSIMTVIRQFELGIGSSSMVRMACRTILDDIDSDITINEISNRLFITRTYLSQVFKEKTGINLVKYLTDVKIERAKVLIAEGCRQDEIAERLGYKDNEYFKKLFKKVTGMTMSEFKSLSV